MCCPLFSVFYPINEWGLGFDHDDDILMTFDSHKAKIENMSNDFKEIRWYIQITYELVTDNSLNFFN